MTENPAYQESNGRVCPKCNRLLVGILAFRTDLHDPFCPVNYQVQEMTWSNGKWGDWHWMMSPPSPGLVEMLDAPHITTVLVEFDREKSPTLAAYRWRRNDG